MGTKNQAWLALAGVAVVGTVSSIRRVRGSRIPKAPFPSDAWPNLDCLQRLDAVPINSFPTGLTLYQKKVWDALGKLVCPHGLPVSYSDLDIGWGGVESENHVLEYGGRVDSSKAGESWFECGHHDGEEPVNLLPSIRSLAAPPGRSHEASLESSRWPARKGRLYYWVETPPDATWG